MQKDITIDMFFLKRKIEYHFTIFYKRMLKSSSSNMKWFNSVKICCKLCASTSISSKYCDKSSRCAAIWQLSKHGHDQSVFLLRIRYPLLHISFPFQLISDRKQLFDEVNTAWHSSDRESRISNILGHVNSARMPYAHVFFSPPGT